MADLARLRQIMRRLRSADDGCPWDLAQTYATLVPHTLEEAFEVADAIEQGQLGELPGELGDLLFQVVFYSQIGEEEGRFGLDEVVSGIEAKLLARHPHVFGDAHASDARVVADAWEAGKAAERRARRGGAVSELDDVALALPALTRARKLQKRAARVGFDWPDARGAWHKLHEEVAELESAAAAGEPGAIEAELGDLLFSVVNLARHLDVDPEAALRGASARFERRFRHVEARVSATGERLEDTPLERLDALWDEAKRQGL